MNYNLLKQTLKLSTAIEWLSEDSKDDFFLDPFEFKDILQHSAEYLKQREFKIYQIDSLPSVKEWVPKHNGMLREAIWLHPMHRILYLACLRQLIVKLDAQLSPGVYSYRVDPQETTEAYPLDSRIDRWKNFQNDFRAAAMDQKSGAVLITDLNAFFDHITCDGVSGRLKSILSSSITDEDSEVIDFMVKLLKQWGNQGHCIPQNYDASSFFGSVYLHNVDRVMHERRYQYFRWADDIRIVAKDKRQALRALHDLQIELAKYHLFLNSSKTHIFEKGDAQFSHLLDVEDDQFISEIEALSFAGNCVKLKELLPRIFDSLRFHGSKGGDDRKFRAFANRLLDIGQFSDLRIEVHSTLQDIVIPWLEDHPEKSDYWVRLLSAYPSKMVDATLEKHLVTVPSVFDWQRFQLWRLATNLPSITDAIRANAVEVATAGVSEMEKAQAITCLGKHGDHALRESLFNTHFSSQKSYVVQRACLIAIQELPLEQKNRLYGHALDHVSEHSQLIKFLSSLESPAYGKNQRQGRECAKEVKTIDATVLRGIGLVKGSIARFRLSKSDFDYE